MQSTDVSPADSSRASISAECTSDNLLQAASQLTAVGTSSAVSSEPASSDEGGRYAPAKRRIPRWKKKFLLAGLFSDYYKQDEYVNKLSPKLILNFFHRNGIIVTIYFQDKSSLITVLDAFYFSVFLLLQSTARPSQRGSFHPRKGFPEQSRREF